MVNRNTEGFVYFIECAGYVKVGHSLAPRRRLHAYRTDNPFDCKFIGILSGGLELEATLHKSFRRLRHKGEWYRLTKKARQRIADMCVGWETLELGYA